MGFVHLTVVGLCKRPCFPKGLPPGRPLNLTPGLRGFHYPSSLSGDPAPLPFLESGRAWKRPGSKLQPGYSPWNTGWGKLSAYDILDLKRWETITSIWITDPITT